jgi:hypothetical protein
MNPALWEQLEAMAEKGTVTYDMRYPNGQAKIDLCEKLCKQKYTMFKGETGPGGSVVTYMITDAGREALAAYHAAE